MGCSSSAQAKQVKKYQEDKERPGILARAGSVDGFTGVAFAPVGEVRPWPETSDAVTRRVVEELKSSAERRLFHLRGNWRNIFNVLDADKSGRIRYEEFKRVVRGYQHLGGLEIPEDRLSDADLKAFWKELDQDGSMDVTFREFHGVLKKHEGEDRLVKLTEYSKQMRGIPDSKPQLPDEVPVRTKGELRRVAKAIDTALVKYWGKRGVHVPRASSELWDRLFVEADSDKNNLLDFFELESALVSKLSKRKGRDLSDAFVKTKVSQKDVHLPTGDELVIEGVSHNDLVALWHEADADHSGLVSSHEWHVNLYRLFLS